MITSISNLVENQSGNIYHIIENEFKIKLLEQGFVKNTEITILKINPVLVIKIRGTKITLRKNMIKGILVSI